MVATAGTQPSCPTLSPTWVNRPPRQITNISAWRVRNVRPYDHIVSDEHFLCDVLIVAKDKILLWQTIVFIARNNPRYNSVYGIDRFGKDIGEQLNEAILAAVMTYHYGSRERAS